MSVDTIATVFVPGKGLGIARLNEHDGKYWVEYTVNKALWKSHWQRVAVPMSDSGRNKPRSVSVAVDDGGNLIATVLYGYGNIICTVLGANPSWQTVSPATW